jgi:hypothetical protein
MPSDNVRTRAAANVLLDMISSHDPDAPDEESEAIIKLALARLQESGAFEATFDDETDVLTLSADPLLTGTLVMLTLLIGDLANVRQVDRSVLISTLREQLLEMYPD